MDLVLLIGNIKKKLYNKNSMGNMCKKLTSGISKMNIYRNMFGPEAQGSVCQCRSLESSVDSDSI